MRTLTSIVTACRSCQHYLGEGRRGGQCQQLGAPVQGAWKACPLAIPAFAPSWEIMDEESVSWDKETELLKEVVASSELALHTRKSQMAPILEKVPA